ncbi:low molecular weight phosphotyrosine protein phosphatase [Kitasatospora sp. NPDC096147]|uniref:arsenate reductase/protein-tyrosine-phosphatase family protein n=1 Tax=Kitasatospora sp. NPDC096147 TaxID=3364093 RepID=UPI0038206165
MTKPTGPTTPATPAPAGRPDPSARPRRVLVVCKGNICRSPAAAALLAARSPDRPEVRSAATTSWHLGEPADPLMVQTMARIGYDLSGHRAALLTAELVDWADELIAVDTETTRAVRRLAGPARTVHQLSDQGIFDPWGGPPDDFARTVREIEAALGPHHRPAPA